MNALHQALGEAQHGTLVNELLKEIVASTDYKLSADGIVRLVTYAKELEQECNKLNFGLTDLFQLITHPSNHQDQGILF